MLRGRIALKYLKTNITKPVIIRLFLVCCIFFNLRANAGKPKPDSNHVFARIKNINPAQRLDSTYIIYRANCRHMGRQLALRNLDELTAYALSIHDKALENSVYEMHADYFSVNKGFNPVSTWYYQKAIDFAAANNMEAARGAYLHKKGMYYYVYKYNVDACRYFLQAQDVFTSIGYANVPSIVNYLAQQAGFYYDLGDYENALLYLKQALKYPPGTQRLRISCINTMGLIFRNSKKYNQALSYFNTAVKLSHDTRDTIWMGIATGNIGSVYFMQQQYTRALPFILTDYKLSLKYKENGNAAHALLRMAKINMVNNKADVAAMQLNEVRQLINGIYDGLKLRIDLYDLQGQLYERNGQLAESITYIKKMELAKDTLELRNNIAAVERVRLGLEVQNHKTELDNFKTRAEIATIRRNVVILILFFLIVIAGMFYKQQMLKVKKDKSQLLSEKKQVDEDLKNAESELLLYTESLRRKNAIIEHFRKEIDRLEIKVVNKDEAEHLEKMMQAHIMTDDNWNEFKSLFAKVHAGFLRSIKKNFPAISGSDVRLLTLMKLQLSNREMANMLGITTDGIKKAKQRLRKKMELPEGIDIEQAISAL
jgi:tetratricopeptide (TPR) repeat protein